MTVFGTIIDGAEVEQALLEHARAWMPTYIAEVKRQKDPDDSIWPPTADRPLGVEQIGSYSVVHLANEKWPENHLPMLLAYCPGLAEPPMPQGDGTISARWQIHLTAIASGIDTADAKALARLYNSAARAAVLQHPGLSGFSNEDGVAWTDQNVYPIQKGVDAERNLMGVTDTFLIGVDQVLNRDGGPLEPLEDPLTEPPEWPEGRTQPVEATILGEGG